VVITDPGIKTETGYKPYDDGVSQGTFIKVGLQIKLTILIVEISLTHVQAVTGFSYSYYNINIQI